MELPTLSLIPERIFIAPLNWGLGHATRTADLLLTIMQRYPEATIKLGSDGAAAAWLRQRFPEFEVIELPGYHIRYPRGKALVARLVMAAPGILARILHERRALRKILKKYPADLLISDNRYGIYHPRCFSVFVTHQLEVQPPEGRTLRGVFRWLNRLHRAYIQRFDQCWVPDYQDDPGLAGKLSHPQFVPSNVVYIGPLSRFRWINRASDPRPPVELLCLISGPEPQRTMFLNQIARQLTELSVRTVILAGTPEKAVVDLGLDHVTCYPNLPDEKLLALIRSAQLIVSRSGYSTIMDLHIAQRRALFVPTPGQTEQEYLARWYAEKGWALVQQQDALDLKAALEWSRKPSTALTNVDQAAILLAP
jgi:hypothetical protein